MPLETGTYISDLVVTNPAHTDPLSQADGHARLIKSTIKATFPNINGAVSSTQTQIDGVVATVNTTGVSKLALGAVENSSGSGLYTSTTGVQLVGGGVGSLSIDNAGNAGVPGIFTVSGATNIVGSATVGGNLTVTGKINGPGSVPIGGMIMWLDDNLPTDGNWCWANGGTLSRTGNGAALYVEWSRNSGNPLRYGAGDGSTTFNVINMQEVVPVGKSTMGGGVSPGLLNSIGSAKSTLGGIFGADTVTLDGTMIPSHNHPINISDTRTWTIPFVSTGVQSNATVVNSSNFYMQGGTQGVSVASGSISGSSSNTGGGLAHNNVGPRIAVNFIIRIA